jgi:hypothetical protein
MVETERNIEEKERQNVLLMKSLQIKIAITAIMWGHLLVSRCWSDSPSEPVL